jgi:hypothetical protein
MNFRYCSYKSRFVIQFSLSCVRLGEARCKNIYSSVSVDFQFFENCVNKECNFKNLEILTPYLVRFEVLIVASTKMAVFWVPAQCSLVEADRRFRDTSCLHHQGDNL